jgi:hypothetical protein
MIAGAFERSPLHALGPAAPGLLTEGRRSWRDYAASAIVLGGLVTAVHVLAFVPFRGYYQNALMTALSDQVGAFAILLAVVIADRATAGKPQRKIPYFLAVLLAAAAWAIVEYSGLALHGLGFAWYAPHEAPAEMNVAQRTIYGMLEWLILGTAVTFVYLDARRAHDEQRRLRRAELERSRTAKRMLESQLQAMQARVEPQFLFNTMAQVRRLYDVDFPVAERMLDDLIAYLRAAMPRMRDTTSTVACEVELARAYLDIVKLRLGNRLRFEIHAPEEASGARMPPMMLLPLIDQAIEHGLGSMEDGALRIAFEIAGATLRIVVEDSAGTLARDASSDSISGIRERLAALYADHAKLELPAGDALPARALIEIPFEKTDDAEHGARLERERRGAE